jgi:hypothetical protein
MENEKVSELKKIQGQIQVEQVLNRSTGELPFAYYCPQMEGKLIWICGLNENQQIESVFRCDNNGNDERIVKVLKDIEEANYMKNELIKDGWKVYVPPKIELTMPDGKKMNREQKRRIAKHIKKNGLVETLLKSSPNDKTSNNKS